MVAVEEATVPRETEQTVHGKGETMTYFISGLIFSQFAHLFEHEIHFTLTFLNCHFSVFLKRKVILL